MAAEVIDGFLQTTLARAGEALCFGGCRIGLNGAPQALIERDGRIERAHFRLDLVVCGAQLRSGCDGLQMFHDAHRILRAFGGVVERGHGAVESARRAIGDDLFDAFTRLAEKIVNGRLDVVGANAIEGNSEFYF